MGVWRPHACPNLKFKMADGRHVGKYSKCHNLPTNGPTRTQLGWSHPIMCLTCPRWCSCHGNGRCTAVATAHWTFCSYGRLEAERVNQFWWNLVYKLGPQWQSCDQILKVGGRSLLESIRNAITRLQMDHWDATLVVASRHVPNIGNALTPLTMGPIETTLGWSHPSNTSAAKPFPWYFGRYC